MSKATQFIVLDSHRCTACWQCIDECPKKVIGKLDFFFHKHSSIKKPGACIGCKKCVKKCPNQAIFELNLPKHEHHLADHKTNERKCVQ